MIREAAELNGVSDRLKVGGLCTTVGLATALTGGQSALVMDVEGAEEMLLDPVACPVLRRTAILVEVHAHLRPGVTARLLAWYSGTHEVERIPTAPTGCDRLPRPGGVTRRQVGLLADEMRSVPSEWFWMTPRASQRRRA